MNPVFQSLFEIKSRRRRGEEADDLSQLSTANPPPRLGGDDFQTSFPARNAKRLALAIVVLLLASALQTPAAMIDLNQNGISDVWELIYGAANMNPNEDSDGDGVSNLQESIAATDPFDPTSFPHIASSILSGTNLTISMPSALGKRYELQSLDLTDGDLWASWVAEASVVARSGTTVSFAPPTSDSPRFFRIAVSDVDSSNSGLNDWEKYQLGLDPLSPFSNGQIDLLGQPISDRGFVTKKLAQQNVIAISATLPTATQPDPGQTAVDQGQFTINRGGFPLNALTVNLMPLVGGAGAAFEGADYLQLPRSVHFPVGSSSALIRLLPVANPNLTTPVVATLQVLSGSGYKLGSAASAGIVIYPTATAFGTGLTGQYFTNSSATYASSANFNPVNLKMTRLDPTVNFTWGSATTPIPNKGSYCVRWTGQVQPQYSETYYFDVNSVEGVKLWVNDQLIIDRWVVQSAKDSIGAIAMQGGVRYDIRLEYFNASGAAGVRLSWYSPSQPKQIIPVTALYPASSAQSAAAVTSPLSAVAFLGQPFTFTVTAANAASSFTAVGVSPGLSLNPSNGVISGVPNQPGVYQVTLTASNTVGVGASVLEIQVMDAGSSVTREVWLGVPGTNVADIPLALPADQTNFLGSLEGITGFGADYGERIRGYFTAPITGNYYFWIAGSDSAEVWISNDNQAVNKVRRAYVSPDSSTAPRQWSLQPSQRSGWLDLIAGQPYYLEILHKAGSGPNDNWSVGWVQDSTGTNTTPSGVVPGYLLSPYFTAQAATAPGALYTADLTAAKGVTSAPAGSATLRLSQDGLQAVLKFSFAGLSSPIIGEHILSDPYLANPNQILFDISAARPQPDGTYIWPIVSVGTLSAADVLEVLNENKVYLTILTANYPNGELVGHFTLANGTQVFTPPPAPPAWTDDHSDANAAARFLIQTTFGPQASDVTAVQSLGYRGWIDQQMSLAPGHHLPLVLAGKSADPTTPYPSTLSFSAWWRQSVTAPDQLRQRVAFALSEIMVVSEDGVLMNNARALSSYYDLLLDNAFGNYRQLLEAVTLSPAMGLYLNMLRNDKGNMVTGIHANENYAREIMQLFSIGLNRTWPDGTRILDSQGNLVPTYDQNVIMGMASVFTGWSYSQPSQASGRLPTNFSPPANYIDPMVLVPTHHDLGTKLLLDNVMRPQAWGSQAEPASTAFDTYCSQDLEAALDSIFNNSNVGPFICRQLIQRLVTSNPSRDYLYRVVQVFNDNGSHVRGDLAAVIKAILLDYEARSSTMISQPTFGKQREPLLRATAVARALPAPASDGGTYSQAGSPAITITTANPHRLNTGDTSFLSFTDSSGQPAPNSQAYAVTVNSPTTFTVNSPGAPSCTYIQTPNAVVTNQITSRTIVTNAITVTLSGHGLLPGNPVYLVFTSGGAASGLYQVVWTNGKNSTFSVLTANAIATSGQGLVPRLSAGGYTQSRTNITISVRGPHGLRVGDPVYLNFTSGTAADGQYSVASVPDATHFTVIAKVSANQTQNGVSVYPLVPPPFARFGSVTVEESTWNMSSTDGSLAQTPLRSPTVFNYFFPGYQFPGALASAGLTTPEFQLTSDTSVAGQMNFFAGGLLNNAANTNGLSSFSSGNGSVVLDLGPWMTIDYTSNGGIPALINALDSLLTGGQLSPGAKAAIVNYVANTSDFPFSSRPTFTQMRDRVRAVVHLLVTSPEFIIQR